MKSIHNVLYVDDEQDNLVVFASRFRRSFNVFTASSAQKALEVLKQNDIHVIISDQRMPEMTGIQLLEQVRDRYPDSMRVILTAYTDSADIIDAINRGAVYAFVKKPWTSEDLGRVIDLCISQVDMKRKSKITMQQLYESAESTATFAQRIPPELRALLNEQHSILTKALSEPDERRFGSYLGLWKKTLEKIDELIEVSEAEYLQLKALTQSIEQNPFSGTLGFLDEDLVFTLGRFPDKNGLIHRLHFVSSEFRQLCRDYHECHKALARPNMEYSEFVSLGQELERDILVFLDKRV